MLISDEYRAAQQHMHETIPGYGMMGGMFAPLVAQIIQRLDVQEVLDYGCGHNLSLLKGLNGKVPHRFTYAAYDPGVPKYSGQPKPAQMVASIDVLEHIEPLLIGNVLDHLMSLTKEVGFFTVHTGPAAKMLPDGRNAHLIQQPPEWWLPQFMERFSVQTFQRIEDGFYVIVYPKDDSPRILTNVTQ